MKKIFEEQLQELIKNQIGLSKIRSFLFAKIVIILIELRTSNLKKIAVKVDHNKETDVNYRRLNRFFQFVRISENLMAKLMSSFVKESEKWTLTMDRTNWKFGKININFLVLAIAYKGMAIPILWILLDNRGGNSAYQKRIEIMEKFINIFGKDKMKVLVADREFIGKEWFMWLQKEDIPFTIRIKVGNYIQVKNKRKKAKSFFSLIKINESKIVYKTSIYGYSELNLVGVRREKELIVFATNMMDSSEALKSYKKRWEIETMFSAFKKRGFDLEATHMTDPAKLSLLFGMISIAFAWSYMVGIWKHNSLRKIKILTHNRREKSYFLYGLEHLSALLYKDNLDKETILPILLAMSIKNDDY